MKGFDFVETVSGGADIKFADDNRVIEVGQAMYAQAASSLLEAVGDGYYYNGSIDVDGDGFYSTLTATLIVYREPYKRCGPGVVGVRYRRAGRRGGVE